MDGERGGDLELPVGRRRFLLGVVAALFAPLTALLGMRERGAAASERLAACRGLFSDRRSAGELGRRYLAQHPGEADPFRLAETVFSEWAPAEARAAASSRAVLRELLGERRRSDFRRGDVVSIGGWVLSRTECRVCAIAALS